jgi:signal transduction histidine kinase
MSEPVSAILDQFHLSRVYSLPELLLRGLMLEEEALQQQGQFAPQKLVDFLTSSPSILLQSLIALQEDSQGLTTGNLEQEAIRDKIFSLVQTASTQYNPLVLSKKQESFYLLHWRHALLCSKYAAALASFCKLPLTKNIENTALLVNLGELILSSVHNKEYLELHAKISSESELCRLEQQAFGINHAELAAEFLQKNKLDSIDNDAIRFHHRAFDEITDASTEVKLCWFANQLASKGDIDFDLVSAGQKLFAIEQEELRAIQKAVTDNLQEQTNSLGIEFATSKRLPLPEKASASNRSAKRKALLKQAQGINRVQKILLAASGDKNLQFLDVLQALTDSYFDHSNALVLTADEDSTKLSISESTLSADVQPVISLSLSDSPSLIATAYQDAAAKVLISGQEGLKVADQQIMSALGQSALLCDPVIYGNKVIALLLIGTSRTLAESYLQEVAIRNAMRRLYVQQANNNASNTLNDKEFHYQQKIREAVHEANNPLSIIKNYLKILSLKQEEDSELHEEIKVIETEIERVKQILNKLGSNSEPEDKAGSLDLNKIITAINKVFSASLSSEKAINIELDLDPKLPFVLGKENSLKQILINLLKNAAEACVENGQIRIETRSNINMNQINYVMIRIIDNGPGIAESIMQNLFKPGNTTKEDGHTGTGLAVVKTFMDELGGVISCQSDEKGTTFTLLLPRQDGFIQKESGSNDQENSTNSASKVYDFKR